MTYLCSWSVFRQGRDLTINICKNTHRYYRVALSALNMAHVEKKVGAQAVKPDLFWTTMTYVLNFHRTSNMYKGFPEERCFPSLGSSTESAN